MKSFKKFFAPLAFFLALLGMVYLLGSTLLPKRIDGIVPLRALYDQPKNSIDVLLIGSSSTAAGISAPLLWEEYGIAGYVLWGSMTPFWNNYYSLKEALKTQTPKLVVMEVNTAGYDITYSDDARQVANVEGMKLSPNKWQDIQTSAPQERWLDLLTMLPLVHERYDELTEEDFKYYFWQSYVNFKGVFAANHLCHETEHTDVRAITEVQPLHEKEQLYLDKILDLCEEENIPLLLLKVPMEMFRSVYQPYYNRVAQIAQERGLTFLNGNLLDSEIGIDPATDYSDDGGHLNAYGAEKMTRFLGQYLKETYDLPDRRGTPGYESWDRTAEIYKNGYLTAMTDEEEYFSLLADQPYRFYLAKPYQAEERDDIPAELTAHLASLGFDEAVLKALDDPWQVDAEAGIPAKVDFYTGSDDNGIPLVAVNGQETCRLTDLTLVVWDTNTNDRVDLVQFPASNGYKMRHL